MKELDTELYILLIKVVLKKNIKKLKLLKKFMIMLPEINLILFLKILIEIKVMILKIAVKSNTKVLLNIY